MARMALATGSCPSCGRTVTRTLTTHHGVASEAYHCPVHGRRGYGSGVALADWAAADPPTMVTLREMYDVVAPRLALDWVA